MSEIDTTADDGNDHKGFLDISDNISSRSRLVANTDSVSTGIPGLDRILGGGYLWNRASVIRGDSGTGKTVFALMFATAGTSDDAAVYASFDESVQNLETYIKDFPNQARVRFLDFTPSTDSIGSGAENIDLGGILVRLRHAFQQSGAKKLVMDALDVLFTRYENAGQVRADVSRIFSWCRENGITVLATAGVDRDYAISRGVLDYAGDCTLFLEQDVN